MHCAKPLPSSLSRWLRYRAFASRAASRTPVPAVCGRGPPPEPAQGMPPAGRAVPLECWQRRRSGSPLLCRFRRYAIGAGKVRCRPLPGRAFSTADPDVWDCAPIRGRSTPATESATAAASWIGMSQHALRCFLRCSLYGLCAQAPTPSEADPVIQQDQGPKRGKPRPRDP